MPRSHRDTRNPRGNDGIDQNKPIPNEMQVTGSAGSVLMTDSRIWHTATANLSDEPRIAMLARYIPWWVSVEMGKAQSGDDTGECVCGVPGECQAFVPAPSDGVTTISACRAQLSTVGRASSPTEMGGNLVYRKAHL